MSTKTLDLKIRRMRALDISPVSNIIRRALNEVDSKNAKKGFTAQYDDTYLLSESFVAETSGSVVGVIGYWKVKDHPKNVAWLDWFAIDPCHQNNGIGTKLFFHLLARLKKKKISLLCCDKSGKYSSSNCFYKKQGFKEFGRMAEYWEDGSDLILLSRKI
jgi:predicted N-acetyltransferase YhbS